MLSREVGGELFFSWALLVAFVIRAGEKIGIVGPSGSGKTTMVHLMMRFFDIDAGRILIDDQDISKVTQDSLRKQFSFVQQDVQLKEEDGNH